MSSTASRCGGSARPLSERRTSPTLTPRSRSARALHVSTTTRRRPLRSVSSEARTPGPKVVSTRAAKPLYATTWRDASNVSPRFSSSSSMYAFGVEAPDSPASSSSDAETWSISEESKLLRDDLLCDSRSGRARRSTSTPNDAPPGSLSSSPMGPSASASASCIWSSTKSWKRAASLRASLSATFVKAPSRGKTCSTTRKRRPCRSHACSKSVALPARPPTDSTRPKAPERMQIPS
mmetsp:Transcript_23722/g.80070  ORF Transcript_23722/g.80070 Transcript_23722/m.80070 type:complete len:236 (+) Transcript_23722:332-1039(+)